MGWTRSTHSVGLQFSGFDGATAIPNVVANTIPIETSSQIE
jgi:hypothetical protein